MRSVIFISKGANSLEQ